MATFWRAAGLSYIQYVTIAARCVRLSLKEEFRVVAMRRQETVAKAAVWADGKMGENKFISSEAEASS
ncbi:mitochondrial ATP synthase epsilon chain-domain-containing protein [Hyaloraphidium curvatum]|nr:mitochondrial ATP synthase epsilon chain-domain-containing protein [Hyaloraphidium curvatum]